MEKGGQDALEMRSTWWHPSSLNRASWCSLMMNRTKLRSDTENETFFGFWSTRHSQNELGLFLFLFFGGGDCKSELGWGVVTVTKSTMITKDQEWCCPVIV